MRDHEKTLGLSSSGEFARFITEDFAFYGHWHTRLRQAAKTVTEGLEAIHYCAQNNFTLQYPVLLAPLRCEDREQDLLRKLRVVSAYLDTLITRRIWNGRAIGYSTMQYAMFLTMREMRGKDTQAIANILIKRLELEKETFATNDRFRLRGTNRRQIHRLLARLTDYVGTSSGLSSRYQEYIQRGGKNGYEIEHIWADHFERHSEEFGHPTDFAKYRNRIGAYCSCPKDSTQVMAPSLTTKNVITI